MTREFWTKLEREFPTTDYALGRFNYEQFSVGRKGSFSSIPDMDTVKFIARRELNGFNYNIFRAQSDNLQGTEAGDIIIGFRFRHPGRVHAISLDYDIPKVQLSTSWHGAYGMTEPQMRRYISFVKSYLDSVPR